MEAPTKNPPRALTSDGARILRTSLATDERAVEADLPDLTAVRLCTGVPRPEGWLRQFTSARRFRRLAGRRSGRPMVSWL